MRLFEFVRHFFPLVLSRINKGAAINFWSVIFNLFFCFDMTEENKQFFEERSKAYQKLGTMSLYNDEMTAR